MDRLQEYGQQRAAELGYNGRVAMAVYGWQARYDDDGDVFYRLPDGVIRNPWHIPAYSTEDAAALEVAEALRQRGWEVTIRLQPGDPVYAVQMHRLVYDGPVLLYTQYANAERPRLCIAICDAALSALEK